MFGTYINVPYDDHKEEVFSGYLVVLRIHIEYWRYRKVIPNIILHPITE